MERNEKADLHIHTDCSDGTEPVYEIVRLLKEKGITTASITDHNSLEAYDQLQSFPVSGVKIVPGIEINAFDGESIHILGYNICPFQGKVRDMVHTLRNAYAKAVSRLGLSLYRQGIIEQDILRKKNLTRRLLAEILVDKGLCETIECAVTEYLDYGQNRIAPPKKLLVEEVIETILLDGGIPVLAHPGKMKSSGYEERLEQIKHYKQFGLKGVECFHPDHSETDVMQFVKIAGELGLYISGGSDFHGLNKKGIELGCPFVGKWDENILQEFLGVLKSI